MDIDKYDELNDKMEETIKTPGHGCCGNRIIIPRLSLVPAGVMVFMFLISDMMLMLVFAG